MDKLRTDDIKKAKDTRTGVTKQTIRRGVWQYFDANQQLSLFPRPVYNRIPNFKGAFDAAQRLSDLDVFKQAKTVLVNPEKSLELVRILALRKGKQLVVPAPRLQFGLLTKIDMPENNSRYHLRKAVSLRGLSEAPPLDMNTEINIDLLIIGSVAVSKNGLQIGIGRGYTDFEFAIIQHIKALTPNTLIVTIVHDCQVKDDMPSTLFEAHDVPVDVIVTPNKTIMVSDRPLRPTHIMWSLISERRLNAVNALRRIKEDEEAAGKKIVLTKVDSYHESVKKVRVPDKFNQRSRSSKSAKNSEFEPNVGDGDASEHGRSGRRLRRRRVSEMEDNDSSDKDGQTKRDNLRKRSTPKTEPQIAFSVKLGNLAKTDRVRNIMPALAKRGVKPFDITWRGVEGFCYLHFAKKPPGVDSLGVDSIIKTLSGMKVGGSQVEGTNFREPHILTVQPTRPITRI
ncbi:methenyltetrahydrofolate synthase domain-containing protein-like [Ctenocephalides felis]|uniref:methenyltetrahydrofolate synthase domain-containing protein-like n=1 Tax=Ctenocephalides felis TaxID=7515 RepID=UPI000E6E1397|nr:methenyltetrahydrofolate synthase domain-containing protein-like [Ctenocephalides felis]XP_026476095.1 methenyltetrahydrofolate synthase domain-containing protein-like [Ctenocephalides felis]